MLFLIHVEYSCILCIDLCVIKYELKLIKCVVNEMFVCSIRDKYYDNVKFYIAKQHTKYIIIKQMVEMATRPSLIYSLYIHLYCHP